MRRRDHLTFPQGEPAAAAHPAPAHPTPTTPAEPATQEPPPTPPTTPGSAPIDPPPNDPHTDSPATDTANPDDPPTASTPSADDTNPEGAAGTNPPEPPTGDPPAHRTRSRHRRRRSPARTVGLLHAVGLPVLGIPALLIMLLSGADAPLHTDSHDTSSPQPTTDRHYPMPTLNPGALPAGLRGCSVG
ncbi:hypothetical protein [Pseudofrankia asymbiotica]|uniref:hypothetical protein n=1 Tax=Pseudofrankia asymbiotica TaxID=1834516 RepID=UPI0013043227|nr:hypothetical protein [Pseudofrankia asymbiotica]